MLTECKSFAYNSFIQDIAIQTVPISASESPLEGPALPVVATQTGIKFYVRFEPSFQQLVC